MGPLPRSSKGNSYILAVCDVFSKYALMFPLRVANRANVTRLLEEQIILMFGAPQTLIVDNGVQFKSKLFQNLMKSYNVEIAYTTNYHLSPNSTERVNRVIKTMLTACVKDNHRLWGPIFTKNWFCYSFIHT